MHISESASSLIALLVQAGSHVGKDLSDALDMPLGQYLKSLVPPPLSSVNAHGQKLQSAVLAHLQQHRPGNLAGWEVALMNAPVIQQADHSFLLLDREIFLNNFLFAIAADLAGGKKILTIQCSSVSCVSRRWPLRGSSFLTWKGGTYNIFGLSKNTYRKSAFIALPAPVTTIFTPIDSSSLPLTADPFLGEFVGRQWESAVDAFKHINAALWNKLSAGIVSDLVIADDRITSELIALHLEDEASPIYKLIFDKRIRDWFLNRKRELIQSPFNIGVNRPEPDHFWVRPDGAWRLCPLIFRPGYARPFYERGDTLNPLQWDFEPEAVAAAVRCGNLIPDIVLIYIARCLLSGVNAVGGPSQQDYVELYRRLFLDCDSWAGLLSVEDRGIVGRSAPSRLGGAPLIGDCLAIDGILASMMPYEHIRSEFSLFLERPVGETICDLADVMYLADHARRVMETKYEYSRHQ